MAKVLFTATYNVPETNRSNYLELVAQLKSLLNTNGISYSIYEIDKQRNHFQEVYVYPSVESYEASDDNENSEVEAILEKIYGLATGGKISYFTAHEVE